MFGFGYLMQRYIINFIVRSALLNTLLITFGLDVVFTYLAQLAFSADFRTINPDLRRLERRDSAASSSRSFGLAAFAIAFALAGALWWLLNATPLGRAIRATSQNLVAARLYGVDPRILYPVTFGIGAALAGAAGGLYGMVGQLTPYIGAELTAKSFVIAIIGSLDNPFRVVLGGCRHRHRRVVRRGLFRLDLHQCDQLWLARADPGRAPGRL